MLAGSSVVTCVGGDINAVKCDAAALHLAGYYPVLHVRACEDGSEPYYAYFAEGSPGDLLRFTVDKPRESTPPLSLR